MRTMYDSTTASAIPADAQMVAGYVDGLYVWSEADWGRFPNAVKVRIAVKPTTNDGHVLDVEPGNWNDAASVAWVKMRRAAGVEPTIYCGNWAPGYTCRELPAVFQAAGEPMPQVWLSDTTQNGQTVPNGCVACQYAISPGYDVSVVVDYWPGVDAGPAPAPDGPDGPDIPDAQTDIASARKLLSQADTLLEHAQEDLNAPMIAKPSPGPLVIPDHQLDYAFITQRLDRFSRMIGALHEETAAQMERIINLEQRPAAEPVPRPAPSTSFTVAAWVPLALSLTLIVASQAATALRALPPSTPLTVALTVLAVVTSSIPLVLQAIAQYQAQQHAHAERMAGIVRQ